MGLTDSDMPESPVSAAEQMAIGWHEGFSALMHAGFTREEAFKLVRTQWDLYWGVAYADMADSKHQED
jgi:hypothetical protein